MNNQTSFLNDDALDHGSGGGAEMCMIYLQALVAKLSTALQLTTGMMVAINDGTKSIAGNIGR